MYAMFDDVMFFLKKIGMGCKYGLKVAASW